MPWVDGSGDPFGILATVIPIFFLTLFLGGVSLQGTTREGVRTAWQTILILGTGELVSLYGLVFGGPVALVWLAALSALIGLTFVVMHAMFAVQTPSQQARRQRLAEENIRRDLASRPTPPADPPPPPPVTETES